jgi:hypothetical protein
MLGTLIVSTVLAGGLLAAGCGDDDDAASPQRDGGTSPEAGASSSSGGTSGGPGPDGGRGDAGGCTFASHVIGLINSASTPTATPTTDLGEGCTPSVSQAEFQSLFP